ncbi:hypothetical protein B9Z55_007294 [Caenorhabditis nigoni]|uniref:Uncharacterized protein n=1 Tax=Caenorhabditis nigoni TaxID=1611254 RepID=A0A2G5V917_9PELO|nr:hypothetical protein B9Z55_007294 [Caenorhabditis nigoni]
MSDRRVAQLEQEKAEMAERISELEEALRASEEAKTRIWHEMVKIENRCMRQELEKKRLHGIIVQQLFRINHLEELSDQARDRLAEIHTSTINLIQ